MYINRKSSVKQIKQYFSSEFGLIVSDEQAEEIKQAFKDGCAKLMGSTYYDTRISFSPDIVQADKRGVWSTHYRTFYTRKEWNRERREEKMQANG